MKLPYILLLGLASAALSFGASVYQVQSGVWNSDIWSNSAGGSVVTDLRPVAGDTAVLTSSLTLTLSGGNTLSVAILTVSNAATNLDFVIDSGTALAASSQVRLMASGSNYTIGGTLTSAGSLLMTATNSNYTISGTVYSGASQLGLGNTGSSTLITGTATAIAQTIVGGSVTVGTGGKMYNTYALSINNGAGDSLTVNGGDVYVNRFYGARLASSNALVSYNVLSGTFTHTGSEAELIGKDATNAGVSLFNQSGGTVSMNGTSNAFYLTCQTVGSTQAIGIYNLSGGTLILNGGVYYGGVGAYREAAVFRTDAALAYSGYVGGKLDFTGGNLVAETIGISLTNSGGPWSWV